MTKRVKVLFWLLSGAGLWAFSPLAAQAATLNVNCNGSSDDQLTNIGKALKLVNHEGPNTINVSGSCHENVLIQGFENLTLNAISGASITDASGGAGFVVDIEGSTGVTLQGFTINGGDIGVFCGDVSLCRFKNNTIQNATDAVSGDGRGVSVGRSDADFDGDVIQNNAQRGLSLSASNVRAVNIQVNNNGAAGIFVGLGSFFVGDPASIQSNGVGVRVAFHSTFALFAGAITGSKGRGLWLEDSSEASIQSFDGPINISGNAKDGVQIHDLSFAVFLNGGPALNVTGNTGLDVNCLQLPFSARGATTDIGGGTTNCTEPQ